MQRDSAKSSSLAARPATRPHRYDNTPPARRAEGGNEKELELELTVKELKLELELNCKKELTRALDKRNLPVKLRQKHSLVPLQCGPI